MDSPLSPRIGDRRRETYRSVFSANIETRARGIGWYYALLLFSVTGQCVMATANELIMIFIGLEISSIATTSWRDFCATTIATMSRAEIFPAGIVATAFLLYGIAWIYGTTGTTNLMEYRTYLMTPGVQRNSGFAGHGRRASCLSIRFPKFRCAISGLGTRLFIKSPRASKLFMSAGPKAAAFAVFLRCSLTAFEPIILVGAVLCGRRVAYDGHRNFAALSQTKSSAAGLQLHRAWPDM